MKSEMLQSLVAFLAPAWSECNEVTVVVKPNSPFSTVGCNISIPERAPIYGLTDFDNYRLWRFGLWHEAQHVKVNHASAPNEMSIGKQVKETDLSFLELSIRNILEDYYVDGRGLIVWKGMRTERSFVEAVFSLRPFPPPPPKGSHRMGLYLEYTLQVFAHLLLHGKTNVDLSQWEHYEIIKDAVAYTQTVIDELVANSSSEKNTRVNLNKFARQVAIKLRVDKSSYISPSWHACQFDFTTVRFNIDTKQLDREVRSRIKSRTRQLEALKGNRSLRQEYEKLEEFVEKFEERKPTSPDHLEKVVSQEAVASKIFVPSDINIASSDVRSLRAYINKDALVMRMKARLRKWATGWVEVHGKYGDELDTEAFIDDARHPFFDEELLRVPKRVALLLDHSGSIRSFEKSYKAAIAALCEALDLLDVDFVVLAFNQTISQMTVNDGVHDTVDNVWLIKGHHENWDDKSLARLLQVQANSHSTPLGEILAVSWSLSRSFKPEVHITLTDGLVSDIPKTKEQVKKYRAAGIKMLGIGIHEEAVNVARNLKILSFNNTLAVSNIQQIPDKIVSILAKGD